MDPGVEGYNFGSQIETGLTSVNPGEKIDKTRKMFPTQKNELNNSSQFQINVLETEIARISAISRNLVRNSVSEDLEKLEIQVEKETEKKRNSITF